MNAQILFIEGQFNLIHIPLSLYSALLQPILRVLLPHGGSSPSSPNEPEGYLHGIGDDNKHGFLNISVTPIECSIVCHSTLANSIFLPVINRLPPDQARQVQISKEAYHVFSVSSAGIEAGQRVMDLTAPLAMAGIPIFFITTYYTDFIVVPCKSRSKVGSILLARGFEFSENDSSYVTPTSIHSRLPSVSAEPQLPSTPPPSNVAELQVRTFAQLRKRHVIPFIDPGLHLVQCSGTQILPDDYPYSSHRNSSYNGSTASSRSWLDTIDTRLHLALTSALTLQPRFLSLTITQDDAPSLLVDKSLLWLFGNSITGDTDGELVPIFLDLVNLPEETSGIVCGVAGKLVEEMRFASMAGAGGDGGMGMGELTFLSTARAGAVVLGRESSERALDALLPLLEKNA